MKIYIKKNDNLRITDSFSKIIKFIYSKSLKYETKIIRKNHYIKIQIGEKYFLNYNKKTCDFFGMFFKKKNYIIREESKNLKIILTSKLENIFFTYEEIEKFKFLTNINDNFQINISGIFNNNTNIYLIKKLKILLISLQFFVIIF